MKHIRLFPRQYTSAHGVKQSSPRADLSTSPWPGSDVDWFHHINKKEQGHIMNKFSRSAYAGKYSFVAAAAAMLGVAAFVPAFAASASSAAATSAVVPWTTYQGRPSHTGYVPLTLDPTQFASLWSEPVGGGGLPLNPVTEADGMVYVTQNGYFSNQGLYVLNAKTGSVLWNLTYPNIYSVNPAAYDNGNVYIQTVDNGGNTWSHHGEYSIQKGGAPGAAVTGVMEGMPSEGFGWPKRHWSQSSCAKSVPERRGRKGRLRRKRRWPMSQRKSAAAAAGWPKVRAKKRRRD